ncbi:PREDICTED: E3 ubiquitin-protein ligase LRSAM1 [Cyprinodon variegatus]|uniref:E3 ubiquitin-protein ligase LRSAM1 n=1 Tax=Cyprinodon variegatus TaxID=28743 RepID=UPI0007426265|nr:PREDICTED: E3 ubiquitin-protein ligase LRSAM1 [Cyprinodon variegatus]
MPLFFRKRKPSEDSQKRLEHQLYWANQNGAGDILDVSGCELAELPSTVFSICKVQQKKVLILHTNDLKHLLPKGCDIISLSTLKTEFYVVVTRCLMRFTELGEEYCPPSQYLLPVLESDCGKQNSDCLDGLEEAWQDQERAQLGFSQQQRAQEAERQLLLEKVRQAEDNISCRISSLLLDNNRQKKSAEFLQALEEDRIRMEQLTAITQEEADSLRKRDVAAAMQKMLSDGCAMSLLQEASDSRRQSLVSEACRSMEVMDKKFDQMLSLQVLDKSKAIAQILQEEEMQKAAFQALQLQKDAVHGYIRNQIKLIEAELMQLTKLEIKKRNLDAENLQDVLVDQRTALGDLLQSLLKQRDQREQELRAVLVEMEKKSDSNEQNYWMIQYQRLLDAKPLSLRMQEAGLEKELVNLLCRLSAQQYLPTLAHHHITTETLRHMTTSDLKKLGISEAGIQKALLNWARERQPATGACKAVQKDEEVTPTAPTPPPSPLLPSTSTMLTPSPPRSPRTPGTPVTPSAPAPVEGPGSSECVVCMEKESQVIFLLCGHVCCCQVCSDAMLNCPLCRGTISQRIRLYHN